MREEYDFGNARKNPYIQKEKKQITINLSTDVVDYFKQQAEHSGTHQGLFRTGKEISRSSLVLIWNTIRHWISETGSKCKEEIAVRSSGTEAFPAIKNAVAPLALSDGSPKAPFLGESLSEQSRISKNSRGISGDML